MSTRSFIIHKTTDGYEGVYCHSDGYPEWNGYLLQDCFRNTEAVAALIRGGEISAIGCDGQPHHYATNNEGSVKVSTLDHMQQVARDFWAEFLYLWDGTKWLVLDRTHGEFVPLNTHPNCNATMIEEHRHNRSLQ